MLKKELLKKNTKGKGNKSCKTFGADRYRQIDSAPIRNRRDKEIPTERNAND